MPIVTSATSSPPTTTPPDGGTTGPDAVLAVSYTAPDGSVWPLTARTAGWYTLAEGVSGLGATPYALTSDPHPRGGARLRHTQPQPRTILWPLHVWGSTHLQFIDRWRRLARAFTSTLRDGPGSLEIARADGTRRRIQVHYQEGFEGLGTAQSGRLWDRAVLSLWCEDPYWVDPVPHTVHREYGIGEDYLQPYPSVSSGRVLGATTVTNPGDVIVWPEWTITGPASLVTFTHSGTGESFVFDPSAPAVGHGALLAGETVTIRTDPVQVRYQDGSNWIGGLNWPASVLWGLVPGENDVTFQLDGSGVGSAVDLSYNPRYETA